MSKERPLQNTFSIYSTSTPYFCNFSNLGCRKHCHVDFYEFCLVTSGSYQHTYNNTKQICEIGTLLFFRPGEVHTFISSGPNSHHYAILIKQDFFETYCRERLGYAENILSTPHVSQKLSGPQLTYLMYLASIVQHSASADRTPVIQQLLSVALFACFETIPDSTSETISVYSIDLQHRFDNYQILSENVVNIYQDYPVSQSFLINNFKRLTGYTIVQYRNLKRMEYAAHLLTVENYSITTIASMLNISNLGYFSQQFKKIYGYTPKQYQLLHRSRDIEK